MVRVWCADHALCALWAGVLPMPLLLAYVRLWFCEAAMSFLIWRLFRRDQMDRKNHINWAVIGVIGIVLFMACYVEAMSLFHF